MADYVVMPKLGFDMREGVLNNWLKQIGETVSKGEVIAEIESDKATLELEAHVSGIMLHYLANAGDVVPIGAHLAIVGEAGEDISALVSETETAAPAADSAAPDAVEPAAASAAPAPDSAPAFAQGEFPGDVKATPVARRLAAEKGISLHEVVGSGPGGRIRKGDVEAHQPAPAAAALPFSPTPVPVGPETTELPASRLRQAIGRRMAESKSSVPHFYVTSEVDVAPMMALRKQINGLLPEESKVSVNDMIVKAAGLALRQFPKLNASYAGDKLLLHNRINVGSAVAVEGGLLTVVQRNSDIASLAQIAADNRAMITRARSGKILPDDVTGSTFTVSNLGVFDVDHFIAIVNPPEAAILAVGSAKEVPVVVDGQLAVGMRMKVTISADHRVTDGAEAAQFLQALKAALEEPLKLLL